MIRKARPEEAGVLTELPIASKRYWRYPEKYFDVWRDELSITDGYVIDNDVDILYILSDPHAVGFYQKMGCGYVLEFPSTIEGRTTPLFTLDVMY